MNSFNDLNGIPASGNAYLMRDILKGKWGFPVVGISTEHDGSRYDLTRIAGYPGHFARLTCRTQHRYERTWVLRSSSEEPVFGLPRGLWTCRCGRLVGQDVLGHEDCFLTQGQQFFEGLLSGDQVAVGLSAGCTERREFSGDRVGGGC